MKTKILFIVVLFVFFSTSAQNKYKVKITSRSEINIKGSSNVNKFTCPYNVALLDENVLATVRKEGNKCYFQGAKLALKVLGFDCNNKMITKDFYKMLKSDEFPVIGLEIKDAVLQKNNLTARTAIEIAGVTKEYQVAIVLDDTFTKAKGSLTLSTNDFNLKQVKKMLGMVVASEWVTIDFSIIMAY